MRKSSFRPTLPSVAFYLALVGVAVAGADAPPATPPITGSGVLVTLFLCGLMGLVGQGARVIVGMKTYADFKADQPIGSDSVFNLARLIFSLIVGFVAGFISGLGVWSLHGLNTIVVTDFDTMIKFAIAGYIGTDVIEAFTIKYFEKPASSGTAAASGGAASSAGPTAKDGGGDDAGSTSGTPSPAADMSGISNKIDDISAQMTDVHIAVAALTVQPKSAIAGTDYPAWALSRDMKVARSKYWDFIQEAAETYGLPVAVISAIGSKESQWGLALRPPGPAGTGDWTRRDPKKAGTAMPSDGQGWGRGLMQIDWKSHEFARTGNWQDPDDNIMEGCSILSQSLKKELATGKAHDIALRCAVSDYNGMSGPNSTYSKDVFARADWISQQGLDKTESA